MDDTIEIEGISEDEATQRACDALNTRLENLGYEIIKGGGKSRGIIGLMRGNKKKIKIRAWRKDARGEDILSPVAAHSKEYLSEVLRHICEEFTVEAIEKSDDITLRIECDEGGLIIGKNGQTLDAIQYLIRRSSGRKFEDNDKKIFVDTEGYRERRQDSLVAMAKRIAKNVRTSKRPETLRPMNSFERRLVHMALKTESGVETKSEGEGEDRCIVILPMQKSGGSRPNKRDDNHDDAPSGNVQ
jgi:spoIIIJ-associated protein